MKKRILLQLCLIIAGVLRLSEAKATETLTICNCGSFNTCTYVITVFIDACAPHHQNCITMTPQTHTFAPGTCFTFSFNPPVGKALDFSSASFNVSNTSNAATATFSTSSTFSPGNCFDASGGSGGVTTWSINMSLTSYTVCSDVIVWDVKTASAAKDNDIKNQANASKTIGTNLPGNIDSYNIYPNPTNSDARISINSSGSKTIRVEIFNSHRETVFAQDKELIKGENTVKIEGLNAGLYYVLLHTENGVISRKFSVQK